MARHERLDQPPGGWHGRSDVEPPKPKSKHNFANYPGIVQLSARLDIWRFLRPGMGAGQWRYDDLSFSPELGLTSLAINSAIATLVHKGGHTTAPYSRPSCLSATRLNLST